MRTYSLNAYVPYLEPGREFSLSATFASRRKAIEALERVTRALGRTYGAFVARVDEVRGSYLRTIAVSES